MPWRQAGATVTSRVPSAGETLSRFVRYADDQTLTLVVGNQEERAVDTALAVGLAERGDRALRLVLPIGWYEPTLHRWPWLRDDLPLKVWSHDGTTTTAQSRPTREATLQVVYGKEDAQHHMGDRTGWVQGLMRWAGEQDDLDAAHRRDVRAWQCRGQHVLRMHRTSTAVEIIGGIAWGASSAHTSPAVLRVTAPLTAEQERKVQGQVLGGMAQRLSGVAHKADEHWLQAVARRHPRRLGLEQPVLRELPAWRPSGSAGTSQPTPRGRGFVDLAGLDDAGTLLLVETKLGADHMLVLQGLDYRIWADANRQRLCTRLDCRLDVPLEISYCVGGKDGGEPSWSAHAGAQLLALATDLRWHVQEVRDWTGTAFGLSAATSASTRCLVRRLPIPDRKDLGSLEMRKLTLGVRRRHVCGCRVRASQIAPACLEGDGSGRVRQRGHLPGVRNC